MSMPFEQAFYPVDSDDEEIEWEEVVPEATTVHLQDLSIDLEEGPSTRPNIEITLKAHKTEEKSKEKKKAGGISHTERMLRIDCHKIHTVALLTNAQVRNQWACDELLHARLLSLTPLEIQNSLALVHKSRIPDANKRGAMFQLALTRLVEWWAGDFFDVTETGHLRSRTFDEVQNELLAKGFLEPAEDKPGSPDPKGKRKGKARAPTPDLEDFEDEEDYEVIRTAKSLMKHALQRFGSRDVSAQLFTALCRALGLPARLVVSLQSVPWQTSVGRPKTKPKSKRKATFEDDADVIDISDDEDDDMEEVASISTGELLGPGARLDGGRASALRSKAKSTPPVKLRKQRPKGDVLGFSKPLRIPSPRSTPPVFWTEVFSRADARWLPIDPIRGFVNKRKAFDPSFTANAKMRIDNRMTYVVAFEEDGYARDLTPRYAREYGAKVTKAQAGGKGQRQWWEAVMGIVTRPYRLHRDDVEDAELAENKASEGMPPTMTGFKDHPLYVLERHLRKDQVIAPHTPELGKFRGEPVYSQSSVLDLKAAENWMRRGRMIKAGEQPLKFVKQRASTVGRKRELEVLREAGAGADGQAEDVMQALYAERQTELYRPAPIVDGIIHKNNFGNIDLYVPSMLPAGAAHIPHKGTAKVARQLGFDYAEAVTSFEFKKGRAFPVLSGIVVAAENEETILEAYWEAEHNAAQKEHEKRHQAVIRRWTRLVQGLRLRKRLQEQYARDGPEGPSSSNIVVTIGGNDEAMQSGGFVTGADDVVQPYILPKTQHPVFGSLPNSPGPDGRRLRSSAATSALDETEPTTPIDQPLHMSEDEDEDMEPVPIFVPTTNRTPKTMAELAAEFAPSSQSIPPSVSHEASLKAIDIDDIDEYVQPTPEVSNKSRRPVPRHANGAGVAQAPPTKSSSKPKQTSAARTRTLATAKKRARRDSSASSRKEDAHLSVAKPRATKRTRVQAAPLVASDRVLRTRKGKSAAATLQEAKEEEAYRQAIED